MMIFSVLFPPVAALAGSTSQGGFQVGERLRLWCKPGLSQGGYPLFQTRSVGFVHLGQQGAGMDNLLF
jgi:hypothetical protein